MRTLIISLITLTAMACGGKQVQKFGFDADKERLCQSRPETQPTIAFLDTTTRTATTTYLGAIHNLERTHLSGLRISSCLDKITLDELRCRILFLDETGAVLESPNDKTGSKLQHEGELVPSISNICLESPSKDEPEVLACTSYDVDVFPDSEADVGYGDLGIRLNRGEAVVLNVFGNTRLMYRPQRMSVVCWAKVRTPVDEIVQAVTIDGDQIISLNLRAAPG